MVHCHAHVDAASIEQEIRRFDPDLALEHALTPPSSWYREPAILALEWQRLLRQSWHPVARRDQLRDPGAYVAGSWLHEPYLLVCGADGEVRAFSNVCVHHATLLLTGTGRCEQIVCPYHGWTYALDGRLVRATGAGGMRGLERERRGLAPLAVSSWGELVFVSWSAAVPCAFDGLDPAVWDSPSGRLVFVAEREYTLACNWKVVIDNYLDGGYHVPVLHGALAASLDLASYRTERVPCGAIQSVSAPRNDGDGGDARIGAGALYAWLYPTWMLNRYGPVLDVNCVVPLAADRTLVRFAFYFAPDRAGDAEFVAASIESSDRIQKEDSDICERVQLGLASSAYDRGRYAPRFEVAAHDFHCRLARDLAADPASSSAVRAQASDTNAR